MMTFAEFLNAERDDQFAFYEKLKYGNPDESIHAYVTGAEYEYGYPFHMAFIYKWYEYEPRRNWAGYEDRGSVVEFLIEEGKATILLADLGLEATITIGYIRDDECSCFTYCGIKRPELDYRGGAYNKDYVLGKKYEWFFKRLYSNAK